MPSKYAELDKQIVAAVTAGIGQFQAIQAFGLIYKLSTDLAVPERGGEVPGWRVVDRRLQALRKVGQLEYSRKGGWQIKEQACK